MHISGKHIIQTLCFDTQATTEEMAHAFANKIRTVDCEALLAKVLSKYDSIDTTIRIDSLTLDIGHIELDDTDFLETEIIEQLEEILRTKLSLAKTNRKIDLLADDGEEPHDEEEPNIVGPVQTKIGLLIHYLVTGSLPWNSSGNPDMEQLLLEIAAEDPVSLKKALLPVLAKPQVIKRISVIFDPVVIRLFIESMTSSHEFIPYKKIEDIIRKQAARLSLADLEKELSAIGLTALQQSVVQQKEFAPVFIQLLPPFLNKYPVIALRSMIALIRQLVISPGAASNKFIYEQLEVQLRKIITRQGTLTEKTSLQLSEKSLTNNKISVDAVVKEKETDAVEGPIPSEEEKTDRFFIDNAGLVLLNAALLQQYFEQLGWVKEKKIMHETARNKIMIWLDRLVWGDRKIHEYGLLLNKILVGIHPSEICDIHTSLTEHEKNAADECLQRDIDHWSMLKNTSIDGLRVTFLRRDGRLSNEDGGWQLHTTSKGYDILIDSLPWSYSIIKFPWMAKPLFTQWQTKI